MKVNKKLLPLKLHYFLYNAGTAPVVPYMPTIARQLGFSSVVVGTMYTVLNIIGMISKPCFGAIADRFQRQKFLFLLCQLLTLAFFAIMFIPAISQVSKGSLSCNTNAIWSLSYCPGPSEDPIKECEVQHLKSSSGNATFQCDLVCDASKSLWTKVCDLWTIPLLCREFQGEQLKVIVESPLDHLQVIEECLSMDLLKGEFPVTNEISSLSCSSSAHPPANTKCEITCNNADLNAIIAGGKIPDNQVTGHYQFWVFFLCLALSWIGMAVVVSVGDAICFEMLEESPHLYGNQRMWGAIGWGIVALLSGTLVDAFSKGKTYKDYSVLFYMMLILVLSDMLVSKKLKYRSTKTSNNIMKDVAKLLKSFRVVLFLTWCIVVGLCTALIWNFLFWHLEDLAAADEGCDYSSWIKSLQGLTSAVQCFAGDLPFFFLSGWILRKIGHINSMSLVLAGFALRFFLYSILTNPWWVLPIELLNGVTFGMLHVTMASYATVVAPPGTEATIQGLVGAVFEGVGVSIGSSLGGILFASIGGGATFRYFSAGAFGFLLIHILVQKCCVKLKGSKEGTLALTAK